MGTTRHSSADWVAMTATIHAKPREEIFFRDTIHADLDPRNFEIRESRDSDANPQSTPIILAGDVTGSMGRIAEILIRKGIGTTFEEILERAKTGHMVSDPHVLVMGIGDALSDRAPIQATEFEADGTVLAKQLANIYLEGNGGSNNTESYDFAWYFAANRTSTDCFEKRNRKGYLFTIGDEEAPRGLTREEIQKFTGDGVQRDFTAQELLDAAEQYYHVFHIIIAQGNYARRSLNTVKASWAAMLGQRTILLEDYNNLAEVVVSTIQVNEGMDPNSVAGTWSGDTSLVVSKAVGSLTKFVKHDDTGLVRL
jgi:hypothetical protein